MSKLDYEVKILDTLWLAPNIIQLTLEKPDGYNFIAGQAAEVSINSQMFSGKTAPFTFTGLVNDVVLELIIKVYEEHNGLTMAISKLKIGDALQISEAWDSYNYSEPGVFIAGGSGITPFISILRNLEYSDKDLNGHKLIWANRHWSDVFLNDELVKLLGDNFYNILSREVKNPHVSGHIDKEYLKRHIKNFIQPFYICGPANFGEEIRDILIEFGSKKNLINIGY